MAMKKRVPRGGFVPEESEDGEEMVEIYIVPGMYQRLQMPEMRGGVFPFSATPYSAPCFRTTIPKRALAEHFLIEGNFFCPDRCDVDVLLKRCEKIDPPSPKDE